MTAGAILLAAGSARRMGEDKLLADLGGKPLALHAFDAIIAAGFDRPVVAISPGSGIGKLLAPRTVLVEVADHAGGMGHSLAAAVGRASPHWSAAIICLADMPFIRPATLSELAKRADARAIIRPCFEGQSGNPVLWGRAYFGELASLTGDMGARKLLDLHPHERIDCGDPGVLFDVDTPDALALARRLAASGEAPR